SFFNFIKQFKYFTVASIYNLNFFHSRAALQLSYDFKQASRSLYLAFHSSAALLLTFPVTCENWKI
ncbi:MAG: hypothetical protein ACE5NG_11400, partial [bacterium]